MKDDLPLHVVIWAEAIKIAQKEGSLGKAEAYLEEAGIITHGIETASIPGTERNCDYINTGDTYRMTICHEDGEYWLGSWGDWHETAECEYEQDNNVIRCACCSEFTPLCKNRKWYKTICESCGHCVDGSCAP